MAWNYSGDVSLSYGGTFVRDQEHYFDVVEVTDLASACGANGLTFIESGSVSADHNRETITNALAAYGEDWRAHYALGRTSREVSRARIAQALWEYGGKDIDSSAVLVSDSPYTDSCAHCGEDIVWRNDRWEHADADENGEFVPCETRMEDTASTPNATPKTPVPFQNGAESWPDLLIDDWQSYAGDDGIARYLADRFDITREEGNGA